MKTLLVLIAAAPFLASSILAGPQEIIKQRAKELANQNNVRQDVAPPTQQPGNAGAGATAAAPKLSPGIARLQTDLAAITAGATVTADQKQKLAQDLMAGGQSAKASAAAAQKLADALAAAFAQKPLSREIGARLAQELDAVLNPTKYPQAKMDAIYADIQAIFQANGLARKDAVAIADAARAIGAEIQKGGG